MILPHLRKSTLYTQRKRINTLRRGIHSMNAPLDIWVFVSNHADRFLVLPPVSGLRAGF
jgi:hypothetical protein